MNHRHPHSIAAILLSSLAALALAACSSSGGGSGAQSLSGSVHGGQSPVTGTTVTLYAAGTGAAATALGTATTDNTGSWSLSFTCPAGNPETYAVASGGNPGLAPGTDNTALHMMAALGACGSLPATINVNEITTVAAAYALNGFISTTNPDDVSASATNGTGLTNAFATAALLADATTGKDGSAFTSGANAATGQKFNSLANSLAACANSASSTSSQCVELFACAQSGASFSANTCTGGTGTAPTDTLEAMLSIVHNPGLVSMAGIYDTATHNAVFSPALATAPNDETLALNIVGNGLDVDDSLAIDAAGNIWVASAGNNEVFEFNANDPTVATGFPLGGTLGPSAIAFDGSGNLWATTADSNGNNAALSKLSATGTLLGTFTGTGLTNNPLGIAIDGLGFVWASSLRNSTINKFDGTGASLSGGVVGGGLNYPQGVAVDANGNVWITSGGNNTINEFASTGAAISPSTGGAGGNGGYTGGGLNGPEGIAIDPSGNVWVAGLHSNALLEFVGGNTPPASCPSSPQATDTGCLLGGYQGGGLNGPTSLAIDAMGHVWATGFGNDSVDEVDGNGTPLSPSTGFTGGGLASPLDIGIDASGNVWVMNSGETATFDLTLTELIGAAAPTRTPLVAAINQGFAP